MLSDGEISYLYDGFGRFEQVTKADGSIMVKRRKAGSFHRRMYSHVYSTTMNMMHLAIPSDVKNRCTNASVIQESSTIF